MKTAIELEKEKNNKKSVMTLADAYGEDERSFTVCFVCTGNTCRSPMAEAYMKSLGYGNTFSRGLHAFDGSPMSRLAQLTLDGEGIEVPDHRAHNVDEGDMARADAVYAMTSRHATELLLSYPHYAEKIHVMPHEIPDPYGGDLDTYKKAFVEIKSSIVEIVGKGSI